MRDLVLVQDLFACDDLPAGIRISKERSWRIEDEDAINQRHGGHEERKVGDEKPLRSMSSH